MTDDDGEEPQALEVGRGGSGGEADAGEDLGDEVVGGEIFGVGFVAGQRCGGGGRRGRGI